MRHDTPQSIAANALAACLLCLPGANGYATELELIAHPEKLQQTIEGFGASDAWNSNFVGKYWSDQEKSEIAEKLFSQEFDQSGSPLGIGLSIWRFNVGAGSAAQGEHSQISNPSRRTEGFLSPDGSYDWSQQSGQQWFLREAQRYEVPTLIAFSNSPPVSMTRNGIAHSTNGYRSNLAPHHQDAFANFLCDVVEHFEHTGITFDFISPINEPQYQWKTSKQEGTPWTNEEIFKMTRSLDSEISKRKLNTKILVPEAADWRNLYQQKGETVHSYQIRAFFSPNSPYYLGGFQSVENRFAVHSYWTNRSESDILNTRRKSLKVAKKFGVQLHQTEYSLIALDRIERNKPANSWEVAQFIAKIIHFDLTEANVASWSFWTAMAEERGDMNRYLLLRLFPNTPKDLSTGGYHNASKNLSALGHFSRFIRPGFQRVSIGQSQTKGFKQEQEILASAYLSPDRSTGVFVVSNLSKTEQRLRLSWSSGYQTTNSEVYLSNSENALSRNDSVLEQGILTLPAQSIITLVETF